MRAIIKYIPEKYIPEFNLEQFKLIRERMRLVCVLTVCIYFFSTAISYLLYPDGFDAREIPFWMILILGSFFAFYVNNKVKTLKTAKLNAYIYIVLILFFLVQLNLIYYMYLDVSSSIYLFALFLVSFTIPWSPNEIIPITFMHFLAYSFPFIHASKFFPDATASGLSIQSYFDGFIYLLMGFILCIVIRKKETRREIENFVLFKKVEAQNKQISSELELARRVHSTLIPQSISTDLVDIAVMYLPMGSIGGDYAKFQIIDKDKIVFIICDVTGHGVSAALLVNRIHTEFERLSRENIYPGELLKRLNNFIIDDFQGTNMYLTAFCCQLDFSSGALFYSNYGHPPQCIYQSNNGKVRPLGPHATLLGLSLERGKDHQSQIKFQKGDKILLFTDGLIEIKSPSNEEYGQKNLMQFIKNNLFLDADSFNQKLIKTLKVYSSSNLSDDIFLLNIHIK